MTRCARYLVLLAGCWAAAQAGLAPAQKQQPPAKPVYDQYEPSRILKTGRQECLHNEDQIGAYCVRVCQKGYVPVPNSNPPRCRSVEPMPAGYHPGPIRRETDTLPKPPKPQQPYTKSGGS